MANKFSLFLLAFLFSACPGVCGQGFPDISIGGDQILRGEFEQTQTMQGFDRPLVSKGHFLLVPKRGIKWNVVSPFPSVVTITPAGLTQESNGLSTSFKSDNLPKLKEIYRLIQGVVEGDWRELGSYFSLALTSGAGMWNVRLTPLEEEPGFPYAAISVDGARFVERVEMKNKSGDVEVIHFSNLELDTVPDDINTLFTRTQ